ncbi:hypothetical protein M408DRAFT_25702 [Serendipita vermifera MAFF 305830]|uniref:Protein kinase domain-containing protein n=1 Tax=Serendipita vermifera MAFF 305830 TaxID=933852 RepID=A0A0C3B1I5_SERVB|nr:hypothetical protein M408DRAFT_25702 [Serendipita vermifera MAFF 305830]
MSYYLPHQKDASRLLHRYHIHETQIEENNAKYQKYLRKQRAQQKKTGTRLPTSSTWFSGQPSQAVMQSPALSTPWKDLTSSDHPQSLDRMTAHISMDTTPEFWGNSMREPQSVEIGRPRVFESSHIDNSESTYESNGYDLTGQVNVQDINPKFKGNYSSVFQGTVGDELVAVKVIQSRATPPTVHRRILRERTVWTLMKHPNILPFYGYTEGSTIGQLNTPFGALISPWYENGDASKFMEEHGVRLSKDARTALWKGVIDGVAYLHQHQPAIVHGDLKPGNVIIDDSGCPRICDFGLAQIFYDEADSGMTTTTEHTGTDRYLAPELLVDEVNTRPTAASDVYAVGCLGLELVFLKKPYSHRKNNLRGFIHTDIKKGIPPAVDCDTQSSLTWSMIKSCWDRQPEARPSASRMAEVLSTTLIHTTEP